jgi:pimeloyl-ACP methyl ester carboxylesterase/DNA-binding CsgD family transcriptional regulator
MAGRLPDELQMRFTTTSDGVRIAYAVLGEGTPFVFTWGPHSSHNQLAWQIPSLRSGMVRLSEVAQSYFFDWRNNGLSSGTEEGLTLEAGVRDLEAIATLIEGPFVLFGGAGAGKIAYAYAAEHPERVSRIVTFCAAATPRTPRPPPSGGVLWFDMVDKDPKLAVKLLAASAVNWEYDSIEAWERYYAGCSPIEYQRTMILRSIQWDVSAAIDLIRCPVLLIQRRELVYPTVEEAMELAERLPNAELLVIAGGSFSLVGEEDAIPAMIEFIKRESPFAATGEKRGILSHREREVLKLVTTGRSGKQIAQVLSLSVSTVNRHIANIYAKTGAHNRAEATMWAVRAGIVEE